MSDHHHMEGGWEAQTKEQYVDSPHKHGQLTSQSMTQVGFTVAPAKRSLQGREAGPVEEAGAAGKWPWQAQQAAGEPTSSLPLQLLACADEPAILAEVLRSSSWGVAAAPLPVTTLPPRGEAMVAADRLRDRALLLPPPLLLAAAVAAAADDEEPNRMRKLRPLLGGGAVVVVVVVVVVCWASCAECAPRLALAVAAGITGREEGELMPP